MSFVPDVDEGFLFLITPSVASATPPPIWGRQGGGKKEARMKTNIIFWRQGPLLMSLLNLFCI